VKILNVCPNENYTLLIESENRKSALFDMKPYLHLEAFQPLNDYSEFTKVQNGGYYIEWPCGADLSADTIEAYLQNLT